MVERTRLRINIYCVMLILWYNFNYNIKEQGYAPTHERTPHLLINISNKCFEIVILII